MIRFRILALITLIGFAAPLRAEDNAAGGDALSLDGATPTFNEEFQKAPVWREGGVQTNASAKPLDDPSFSWAAGYIWDHPATGTRKSWPPPTSNFPAWTSNNAGDADPNGDMIAQIGAARSPLAWSPGNLNLIVSKMPADLAATVNNPDPRDYMGATISSFPYAQTYGVFAMSAKLPDGMGLWPAFWLIPADKTWPPEIDIMEVLGRQPTTVYTTLHTNFPAKGAKFGHATDTHIDLGSGFHEYAVDWGPERIDWYFDRKLVFSQPTPEDLHKPCYIIVDLGVGTSNNKWWAGAPDSTTKLPATMQVAYVKAWQRPAYAEKQDQ
jgi:beta-glucanase (GH16 family)